MTELRSRILPPDFWFNSNLGALSDSDRLLFQFLVNYADDFGRFELDLSVMRGLFWMHQPTRTIDEFSEAFGRVVWAAHYIHRYSVDTRIFCVFTNWSDFQKPPHPKKSRIPVPETTETFRNLPKVSVDGGNPLEMSPQVVIGIGVGTRVGVGVGSKQRHERSGAYTPEFEAWWLTYPKSRRREKPKAYRQWLKIAEADWPDLGIATANYAKSTEEQYIRWPERFLRDGFWRDYIEQDDGGWKDLPPTPKHLQNPLIGEEGDDGKMSIAELEELDRQGFFDGHRS